MLALGASGITMSAGAGALTVGSATPGQAVALSLGGGQSWANNSGAASTAAMTIENGVSLGGAGAATLTLGGDTGATLFNAVNGVVGDGAGTLAVTVNGGSETRWLLAGANTYSGATTITNGALQISNASALGSTVAGTSVASGSALLIQNDITVTGEALTIAGDGLPGTQGAFRSVSGDNVWTGNIFANASSNVRIASDAGTLTLEGNITTTGNALLVFQGEGDILVTGNISTTSGTAALVKSTNGTGTLTLAGNNSYATATTISNGTVIAASATALGTAAAGTTVAGGARLDVQTDIGLEAISISGGGPSGSGTLVTNSGTGTVGGSVTLSGNASIGGEATLIINGVIGESGSARNLSKVGNGTTILNNANTYSGSTFVNVGTLNIRTSGALGSGADVTVGGSGSLHLQDSITLAGKTISLTGSGVSGAANGALQSIGGSNRWTGDITAVTGSGGLARIGAINGSTLTLDGAINGTGTGQLVFQTGSGSSNSGTIIVNGDISFAGERLTKSSTGAASGTLILLGMNDYGQTIISSGVVQVGNGGTTGTLGSGPVTNAGTLIFNRSDDITIANVISGSGAVSHRSAGTVTLAPAAGSSSYSGGTSVTAGGTLVLDFNGLATPTNAAGTGSLSLAGSRLNVLGKATDTSSQAFGGFTLNAGGSFVTVDSNGGTATDLTLGAITRNIGGTVDFTLPASGSITTSSAVSNAILGGYATVGSTTWATKSGSNIIGLTAYTNDAWSAGNNTDVTTSSAPASDSTTNSLRFNTAAALTVTLDGTNVIDSGGILVTANVGANLSTISGGTLVTGTGLDLVVFQNNTAAGLTIGSAIGSSFTKSGDGLVTLEGGNAANFITRINAGTLSVSNASNLGGRGGIDTITFTIGSTGILQLTGNGTFSSGKGITLNGNGTVEATELATLSADTAVDGSGNFTKSGAGTLVFSSATLANTYTGATIVTGGTLEVKTLADGGVASGLGASTNDASNLVLNGGGLRYSGATPGSTDHRFTVGTAGGTLDASGATLTDTVNFTNTGSVDFAGSGARTLTLAGTNTGANTLASALGDGGGATSLQKTGTGAWTVSGANTYSGGTTVVAGSLSGSVDGAFGTGDVSVLGTAVSLTIQTGVLDAIADSATLSLAGGGTGNLADAGFAMLVAGVNESVSGLILGGVAQFNIGTYGATGSGATYVFDEYFAGTGVVTLVVPEPGSAALLLGGLAVLGTRRRRR